MCGIAGILKLSQAKSAYPLADIAQKMSDCLAHRGPDDHGVWSDKDNLIALSQRRLSIIDLSPAGHQPMLDKTKKNVITFNGEIYNYLEIKNTLNSNFGDFSSRSDTEVLLNLLISKGIEGLHEVDGMYAFGLWNLENRNLLLARDPFGKKPLYYTVQDGYFAFASELNALSILPEFDETLDPESIAEYFAFQYIGAPNTIYKNVKKLPPGHFLEVTENGDIKVGRHFEYQPNPVSKPRKINELSESLEQILTNATKRRLISDVPLGSLLSGGIDSSLVTAIASKLTSSQLSTFTIGFNNTKETEHEYARAISKYLITDHHEKVLSPDILGSVKKIGSVLDEPNGDSSCLPTYLVSEFMRSKVTVGLSGDGGDELFGGYDRYLSTLSEININPSKLAGDLYLSGRIMIFPESDLHELLGYIPERTTEKIRQQRNYLNNFDLPLLSKLKKLDIDNYMPGAVLAKVDRMSMQHALEIRSPLLSIDVAKFTETLHPDECINGDTGKLILRDLAYKYIPREILDRPKMGFGLPMFSWGRSVLLKSLEEEFIKHRSLLEMWLGSDCIKTFYLKQKNVSFNTYQVWCVLIFEQWLKKHSARRVKFEYTDTISASIIKNEPCFLTRESSPSESFSFDTSLFKEITNLPHKSCDILTSKTEEIPKYLVNLPQINNIILSNDKVFYKQSCENLIAINNPDTELLTKLFTAGYKIIYSKRDDDWCKLSTLEWTKFKSSKKDSLNITNKFLTPLNNIRVKILRAIARRVIRKFGTEIQLNEINTSLESGNSYFIKLPELAEHSNIPNLDRSSLLLFENETLLDKNTPHDEIRLVGNGGYQHWEDGIYFAATDNSNPILNGKKYSFILRPKVTSILRKFGIYPALLFHRAPRTNKVIRERYNRILSVKKLSQILLIRLFTKPLPKLGTNYIKEHGFAFLSHVPKEVSTADRPGKFSSKLLLFEDNILLKRSYLHSLIRYEGKGRYTHWEEHIWFSSTDNQNCNSTKRSYRYINQQIFLSLLKRFNVNLDNIFKSLDASKISNRSLPPFKSLKVKSDRVSLKKLSKDLLSFENSSKISKDNYENKVAHYIGSLYSGGAERQFCYTVSEMIRRGIKVDTLLHYDPRSSHFHYLPLLEKQRTKIRFVSEPSREYNFVDSFSEERSRQALEIISNLPPEIAPEIWNVYTHLKTLKPRVLHCWLDYQNIYGGIAGILADIPKIVLSVRNSNPSHFPYFYQEWFKDWYNILSKSNKVIFTGNSESGNRDYAQWLNLPFSKFKTVINGVDHTLIKAPSENSIDRFKAEYNVKPNEKIILGVFRLVEEKDPLTFLKTISCLTKKTSTPLKVFIAGEGHYRERVEREIIDLNLSGIVTLLGRRDDTHILMEAAEILLHPSRIEGTPNVVLEAMYHKLPVIACPAGSIPEIIIEGENGFICQFGDFNTMAETASKILGDDLLRERLGQNSKNRVFRHFSVERLVDESLSLYPEITPTVKKPSKKDGLSAVSEIEFASFSR